MSGSGRLERYREKLGALEEGMDGRQQKLFETTIFLGKLVVAGTLFQLILFLYPDTYGLQAWYAGLVSRIIELSGPGVATQGIDVLLQGKVYRITQDCLGWKSMAAFLGLIFASTNDLRDNYRFLAAGILLIAVANLIRVLTTIYLDMAGFLSFEIVHGVLWKWSLTLLVLGTWAYWFRSLED